MLTYCCLLVGSNPCAFSFDKLETQQSWDLPLGYPSLYTNSKQWVFCYETSWAKPTISHSSQPSHPPVFCKKQSGKLYLQYFSYFYSKVLQSFTVIQKQTWSNYITSPGTNLFLRPLLFCCSIKILCPKGTQGETRSLLAYALRAHNVRRVALQQL